MLKFQRILPSTAKKNVISKHGSFMNDEIKRIYDEFFAWFMSRFLKKENITIPTNLCHMFLLSYICDSCDEWYLNIKDDWCLWFSSVSYWYLSVRVSPLYLCFLGREVGCPLVALCVGTWKGGRVLNLFFKVIDPGVTNFDFTSWKKNSVHNFFLSTEGYGTLIISIHCFGC